MRNGMRAVLVCAVLTVVWSTAGTAAAPPGQKQSYGAGTFALEIDGNFAGFVTGVDGGMAFGDVVKEAGEEFFFKKHLGNPGFRDIRLEFGADMDKSFLHWIGVVLQGEHVRLNGAIVAANFNGDVVSRLEFYRAQITEVTFPAVDAGSKESARISVVLTPEQTILNRKVGGKIEAKSAGKGKNWLSSNFKLTIDGLDATRVTKIDALTIKLPWHNFNDEQACLTCELPPIIPAKIDFPNLVVTIIQPATSFHDWFEDFVIAGNNSDEKEKAGSLEYLTPDLKTLFTIKLRHLGIFEAMPVVNTAGGDSVARLLAAIYCESMEFTPQ